MKKNIQENIINYIDNYISDYYPAQQEGEYTGDIDNLAHDLTQDDDIAENKETLKKIIKEMIKNKQLIEDSREWVNVENEQHTIYVDVIITKNFKSEKKEGRDIRKNQSSWEYIHPENYEFYETIEDFKNELLKNELQDGDDDSMPISVKEVKSWKKWDDISGDFDII